MIKKIVFRLPIIGPRLKSVYSTNHYLQRNLLSYISEDSVWLFTIPKSGTTYTMLFLVNYLSKLYTQDESRIGYGDMMKGHFIHTVHNFAKKNDLVPFLRGRKNILDENTPYSDLLSTHVMVEGGLWSRNISLYRNPLDFLISFYFYKYKNRRKHLTHPRKIIIKELNRWIKLYKQQLALKELYNDRVLMMCYEEVIRNPKMSFTAIIDFLGLSFDEEALNFALRASSSDQLKEEEVKSGSAVVAPRGKYSGSFIRSGKIGQWKEYFNEKDLDLVRSILNRNGISLDSFVLN